MPFIGTKTLTQLLTAPGIITPFEPGNIKNGAYELTLGDQVFLTNSIPRAVKSLNVGQEIYIDPGQFALLLTEETVKIPEDKIAFISIKAGIKFKGLVNVSGFHVDPGFEGKLLFSVYNAGPSRIVLSRGKKCFPIWFAELNEKQDYTGTHQGQNKIPDDPLEALSQGDLASPNSLLEMIKENYTTLESKISVADEAQKGRIGSLERDQKAMDYLIKTALGLVIILIVKFLLDWTVFNEGLKKGGDLKQKEIIADSILNQCLEEKRKLLFEIDSLQKIKSNLEVKKNEK